MTAITLDTHNMIKRLTAVGFNEQQAEVQTQILTELVEDQLVTKTYLDLKIAELKTDAIKYLIPLLLGQAGLIAALVKML